MISSEFNEDWEKLIPVQKEAAEWKNGPLLLIAGPGSGKTQVLTCRITHILANNLDNNFRVLALTFTNTAADEMRKKIQLYLSDIGNRVFIGTFHSFCIDVIRKHGEHIGIKPDVTIYSQREDLLEILYSIIEKNNLRSLLEEYQPGNILNTIQTLKSQFIDSEQILENSFIQKNFDPVLIKKIYEYFEIELSSRNGIDFPSLIFKTYQLFVRYPSISRFYQKVYPFICIDEFQDTNEGQFKLLTQIIDIEKQNIFIVADDDQIIYGWNGADYKRLEEFKRIYCPKIIQIPTNFRCPPAIVKIANMLIQHNTSRMCHDPGIPYRTDNNNQSIRILPVFETFEEEIREITNDIFLHKRKLGEVVILARTRKLLEIFHRHLIAQQIPSVILQRKDEFESIPMIWTYSLLTLLHEPLNARSLEKFCGTTYQIFSETIKISEILQLSEKNKTNYLDNWIKIALNFNNPKIDDIIPFVNDLLKKDENILPIFEKILNCLSNISKSKDIKPYAHCEDLFPDFEEEFKVWKDMIQSIRSQHGNNIYSGLLLQELKLRSKESPPSPEELKLMTIHGSKGKEFDHVYLIGCVDDLFPSYYSIKLGDNCPEMEEERRNCFVAITRTKKTLTFSYAKYYFGYQKMVSRFLIEMGIV